MSTTAALRSRASRTVTPLTYSDDHPVVGGPLLKVREVAERLNIPVPTLYTMIHRGEIVAIQIGRRSYRIPENAIDAFRAAALVRPDAV